ncbi:MAG: Fic family protein [Lachnospiraceae bacterium]|nr:Fic family protein [Lachnospiraceae bacterium]
MEVEIVRDTAIEMAKRLLVDSIWKSANLEGLGTTFPKTEAILANAPTTTKTEEVLFIINMKRAWQFLLDNLEYSNCLMLLREYDKIVGELLFSYAGEIRTIPVQIGGTSWEPEMPHTGIIMDSIKEIEQIDDAELKALKYFCYIARTQMFIDGNKRVAQLMANKVLIENDIGIFQIPIEKLEEFKGMLIEFYETGNDVKIIDFMKIYCIRRVQC